MSEDSFDMGAGDVCLDFVNTNDWHASPHPIETLHNYSDLIAWAQQAGTLTDENAEKLMWFVEKQPENAEQAFQFAIQLREAIYRIFVNRSTGIPVQDRDIDFLNGVLSIAMGHKRLVPSDGIFKWDCKAEQDGTNIIAWNVALAAADLLTSDRISRVRQCEDDRGCGYLFMDMSKNHSRRWCSMESCGNRAKAHRHYSRSKEE